MIQSKEIPPGFSKMLQSLAGNRHLQLVCVIFPLFAIQITSAAQVPFYPETIIPISHPITSLLRSKKVHRELRLTSAEIDEAEKVVSEFDLPLWRLRDLPFHKRNEKAVLLINQLRSKLAQILSDRQTERLNQLVWQVRGIEAILEPQVALRLNLLPEQKTRIRTSLKTLHSRISSLQNNPDLGSTLERDAYIQNLQAETRRNIQSVLNSYQRGAFVTLMGSPFNFSRIQTVACQAPEFEIDTWINSSPVKPSELKGKVTVVHFYAFGCSNCIRTLP